MELFSGLNSVVYLKTVYLVFFKYLQSCLVPASSLSFHNFQEKFSAFMSKKIEQGVIKWFLQRQTSPIKVNKNLTLLTLCGACG